MISLRTIRSHDTKELYELFVLDPDLKHLDLPLSSYASFAKWINELLAYGLLGFGAPRVIVTLDQHLAGLILLSCIDRELGQAEMGTWIGLPYRGSGINQQAKQKMLYFAFNELGLKSIYLYTAETNLASIKSLERLPYVTLPDQNRFQEELKHRSFLHRRSFKVFEVQKEHFMR